MEWVGGEGKDVVVWVPQRQREREKTAAHRSQKRKKKKKKKKKPTDMGTLETDTTSVPGFETETCAGIHVGIDEREPVLPRWPLLVPSLKRPVFPWLCLVSC